MVPANHFDSPTPKIIEPLIRGRGSCIRGFFLRIFLKSGGSYRHTGKDEGLKAGKREKLPAFRRGRKAESR